MFYISNFKIIIFGKYNYKKINIIHKIEKMNLETSISY